MTSNPSFDDEFDDLPSASDERAQQISYTQPATIGTVMRATKDFTTLLLNPGQKIGSVRLGSYVVVDDDEDGGGSFLGMVTDVQVNSELERVVRGVSNKQALLKRGLLWTEVVVAPHLWRGLGEDTFGPVRTVPAHISKGRSATQEEISAVFGDPNKPGFFHVGQPIDMQAIDLAIDLRLLVERSSGLFGMSGTGKSFLGRMLMAGIIRERLASALIFDMHNEYGWKSSNERKAEVKGLKQLFPGQVNIFTLDDDSSRRRGSNPDMTVVIGMDQVTPDDIAGMQSVLDLSEMQIGAVYALARKLGPKWLEHFLDDDFVNSYNIKERPDSYALEGESGLKGLADATGQQLVTMQALRRRFEKFRKYGFLQTKAPTDVIDRLLRYIDAGNSVVLEFGKYGDMMDAYMFVVNFLTSRLHERYKNSVEAASGGRGSAPQPLVIVIEEAHKFLDPAVVDHTAFGNIAREMRKYNVTLFVIDQRPSQISPEVMSQIATRVTLALRETTDIAAVLQGINGAVGLRDVLARLDTRQQALIMGHAVPIPVVVQTRTYDADFYRSMGFRTDDEIVAQSKVNVAKIRGPENFNGFD